MFGFNLWDFLIYQIPWWLQITLLAVPVAALFWFAVGIFGWNRVKGWIIPALALIGAAGALSRAQQKGYGDRKQQEQRATDEASDFAAKKRDEVEKLPDDQRKKRFERWEKP